MENLIAKEMQKRNEIVNNFEKNYLLEAGAGAGKTSIIVERVINHIIGGKIEPQNIVAITFTKAASLELAERIQKKAVESLEKEELAYAKDKLERVEEIFTGTIHSFCELLLREMPFEAGLTPGYKIVEDSEEFYNEIWYDFLREFEEVNQSSIEILNLFNIDYRDLKQSAFVAMDNPDINFIGFKEAIDLKTLEKMFKDLDTRGLDSSLIKKASNFGKLCIEIIENKKDLKDYIEILLLEACKISDDEDLSLKFVYKNKLKDPGLDGVIELIELLITIYKNLNANIYNISTDFVNRVVDYKNKSYTNSLTFNDLLFRASSLIKNSEVAREHFKDKFKCFYIDEAQDTDPMQAELLLLLSHDGDVGEINSLEEVSPRDGSLFIVGDPKQSIYRFRRADITIYESVKKVIASRGEVVYLDINFRSTESICSWVEDSFKDRTDGFAFKENPTLFQAGFERILSLWNDKKEKSEQHKFSGVYGYEFSEDLELKEEEYVAAMVEDMINSGYIEEKIGRDGFNTRRIENKDIMILTKSNEETGRYLNELKNRDISALLAGEKRLGDTREVLNLFLLIDFITDFKDSIKLAAVLRNSFYLEFETINYLLKLEDYENIISNEDRIKSLKHPHLKQAIFYLREIIIDSEHLRPDFFIENLIKNRMGVYDLYKEYSEIEKRDADSALVQTLEILKTKKHISLYDIREELKDIIDEKVNYELPINLEFSQNAVRIMNIHKAKGLESSIVILVGRDKKRTLGGDNHYVEKTNDGTDGFLVFKSSILAKCPDQESRKVREKEFKDAELDRLIYVAATRSKSVLITPKIDDEKMFLNPLSNESLDIIDLKDIVKKNIEKELSPRKLEEIVITDDLIKKMNVSIKSYSRDNPSKEEEFKENSADKLIFIKSKSPRGAIYGNLVHRAFELILKDIKKIEDIIGTHIDYAINLSIKETLAGVELDEKVLEGLHPGNNYNIEDIDEVEGIKEDLKLYLYKNLSQVIDRFLNNKDIVEVFLESKRVFTEFPFTININPYKLNIRNYRGNLITNGIIDLLIQQKDNSFVIVDYKTDLVSEDNARTIFKERYKRQLETYKIVLEDRLKCSGGRVDRLLIYSTFLNRLIEI